MSQNPERWRLIQMLLGYQGWLFHPKSKETKVWMQALKKLIGDGPHGTFDFQPYLPRTPLPDLDQSLHKFLEIAELLTSEEDFQTTKRLVEDFRMNEGPKIQAYLQKKMERNIRTGIFPPEMLNDLIPICMHGHRNLFNTTRIPAEPVDVLQNFQFHSNHHVIVIRKGHFYKLPVYKEGANGDITPLSLKEIRSQLQYIVDETESLRFGTSVAALTTQERPLWAKQRKILRERNEAVLATVEKAMFVACLDTAQHKTQDEFLKSVCTGDGTNRWFDKSFNLITNADGDSGINSEHSGLDGSVLASVVEYLCASDEAAVGKNKNLTAETPAVLSDFAEPIRLQWDINDVEEFIDRAVINYKKQAATIDLTVVKAPYGAGFIKKLKLSPDGYIQMAMQLAYYRLHGEIPRTYEAALARLFALGRTFAVNPVSKYSIEWVKIMDDKLISNERKIELLRKSIKHQFSTRIAHTAGKGFERHMLALQCAAKDLGMNPKIFIDKAFTMPLEMLTSHTPSALDLEFQNVAFPPLAKDGYAVSYLVSGDSMLKFTTVYWKPSGLSGKTMNDAIVTALKDMQELFLKSNI